MACAWRARTPERARQSMVLCQNDAAHDSARQGFAASEHLPLMPCGRRRGKEPRERREPGSSARRSALGGPAHGPAGGADVLANALHGMARCQRHAHGDQSNRRPSPNEFPHIGLLSKPSLKRLSAERDHPAIMAFSCAGRMPAKHAVAIIPPQGQDGAGAASGPAVFRAGGGHDRHGPQRDAVRPQRCRRRR